MYARTLARAALFPRRLSSPEAIARSSWARCPVGFFIMALFLSRYFISKYSILYANNIYIFDNSPFCLIVNTFWELSAFCIISRMRFSQFHNPRGKYARTRVENA
jgi:hypothetical protein